MAGIVIDCEPLDANTESEGKADHRDRMIPATEQRECVANEPVMDVDLDTTIEAKASKHTGHYDDDEDTQHLQAGWVCTHTCIPMRTSMRP